MDQSGPDHTSVFEHEGAWTEDDFRALLARSPTARPELVEGTLFVGPRADDHHDRAVATVRAAVEKSLPDGLRVLGRVPLRTGPDCLLVPDIVVARTGDPDGQVIDAAETVMVVDVVGRAHGIAQRSFTPQLYALARIPYAVLVDLDAPFGVANMIIGGRYHEFAKAGAGERLAMEQPFRIEVDLAAVVASNRVAG